MKIKAALFILIFLCSSCFAGETSYVFDKNGRSQGRITTSGNTTRFYDKTGRSEGSAKTNSTNTRTYFYDKIGRSAGSMSGKLNTNTAKMAVKRGK